MRIEIMSHTNFGAIYEDGNFVKQLDTLKRGCSSYNKAKALGISIGAFFDHDYIEMIELYKGDEPYVDQHNKFPENRNLLAYGYKGR